MPPPPRSTLFPYTTLFRSSLEGERGMPRLKPPFPAIAGLYGKPTVVNNVETLSTIPHIVSMGGAAYAEIGVNKSRSEEHTSELQSHHDLVCRLLLEKKKKK